MSGYDALLNEICLRLGFCGSVVAGKPRHVGTFLPMSGTVSADQFVRWVFEAEGLDPAGSPFAPRIREAFVRHMGAEVVDVSELDLLR